MSELERLKNYKLGTIISTQQNIARHFKSGVPLGGIGCGSFEWMPDGSFQYFQTNNNWDVPIKNSYGAFLLAYTNDGNNKITKLLSVNPKWLVPKVRKIIYYGHYPFAESGILDDDLHVNIEIRVFSPLIPHDVKNSSLPLVLFNIKLKNKLKRPIDAAIAFSLENFIGVGGLRTWGQYRQNLYWNDRSGNYQQLYEDDLVKGLQLLSQQKQTGQRKNCIGEYGLFFKKDSDIEISTCDHWNANPERSDLQELFAHFSQNGILTLNLTNYTIDAYIEPWQERDREVYTAGVVSAKLGLQPAEERELSFALCWYMPHLIQLDESDIGHYYSNFFSNAVEIGRYGIENEEELRGKTSEWQELLFQSNLPRWYIRKLINDAFTLSTNTLLSKDGLFTNIESPFHMGGCLGTMDQKLVAHIFYHLFFPELDKVELQLFAKNQQPDGSISHMIGSLQGYIGSLADSAYQITHWPDLAASFVWQIYKYYLWTGDAAFLNQMKFHLFKAIDWLLLSDRDGDHLPEGGSTWDSKHYKGAFIYNASVTMAALAVAINLAGIFAEHQKEKRYNTALQQMRNSLISNLFNGRYFDKFQDPVTNKKSEYCFTSQLAGEWMRQLAGLDELLPEDLVKTVLKEIFNLTDNFDLPPIETASGGNIIPERYKGYNISWPGYAETFICANGFYHNLTDEAWQKIKRMNDVFIHLNRNIWNFSLFYNAETGLADCHARYYMSSAASWFGYLAMLGVHVNWPQKSIELSPNLPDEFDHLNAPVFLPNVWMWLEYSQRNSAVSISFHILKVFNMNTNFQLFSTRNTCYNNVKSVMLDINQKPQPVSWELNKGCLTIKLKKVIQLGIGDKINIKCRRTD